MTNASNSRKLTIMVIVRLAISIPIIGLLLFLPAGTLHYWQAWLFIAVLFTPMFVVFGYLLKNDPDLLERRMRSREQEAQQNRILKLSYPAFLLVYILPGFDIRYGWSNMPAVISIIANLIIFGSYLFIFAVFRENSYASRVVEVEEEQKVISTGPYALVRHPMYLGVLLMYCFSPIALGSWWALIPAVFIPIMLVARIKNEEEVLLRDLPGYAEYQQKTRYRMIPWVW